MKTLYSIEEIEAKNVLQTGCRPVLVHADDLNFYLCKYLIGNTSADKLFLEYLAVAFLKVWEVPVPDCNLVFIKHEHLPPGIGIPSININCPCFGSQYDRNLKEIDRFLNHMNEYQSRRFINPTEFLQIAFFDIWVSNDDRHPGNYNLFIQDKEDGQHFMAYDHEAIFNTGNLARGLYHINENDSILSSPFLLQLFTVKELKDTKYINALKEHWFSCIERCKAQVPAILSKVPNEWRINTAQQNDLLLRSIFSQDWIESSFRTFLEILQVNLNKREN